MSKRIVKRDNFDGGFIVTGKGDNAVITPKQKSPNQVQIYKIKKEEQEKPKRHFCPASGHYWFRNTPVVENVHTSKLEK